MKQPCNDPACPLSANGAHSHIETPEDVMYIDELKRFHKFDLYVSSGVACACIVALISFWVMFIVKRTTRARWIVACIPVWLLYITAKTYESQLRTQLGDPIQIEYDALKKAIKEVTKTKGE